MNCSEEEIDGLAALVFDTRQRVVSIPLAILSPNFSSSMARIAKSLPIAIKASPSRDQENKRGAQDADASPRTPPLVKEIKRNRSVSSTPQTPSTPAVKVVKFSACKPSPNVFSPREDVKAAPRPRPTSALRELFSSPGASSAQFQRRPSTELLSIKVTAPEVDLALSLVIPKDASVLSVIVSILHKLDGSSASTQLNSSGFELRMVDDDEPDLGLPALGANQQIGSFGCTSFALVRKAGATKSPSTAPNPVVPVPREDQSGASAPLPSQSEGLSQARQAEPRVATASCFHFDEFSASMYKEFDVVKVNRHGFRQLRKMGIDRDKIYNLAPKAAADGEPAKKGAGLFGGLLSSKSGAVKKKSRLIREVRSIDPVDGQPMSISLVYNEKGGETSTYVFITNSGEEAADIIARVRFLQRLHTRNH